MESEVSVGGEDEDKEDSVDSGDKSEVIVVSWSVEDEANDSVESNDCVVSVVSKEDSVDCDSCAEERAVEAESPGKVTVSEEGVFIVSAIVEDWFGSVVADSAGSSPMIRPSWHCSTI